MPLNISIDVDGTLVDAEGQILPGAKEAVVALNSAGFALTIWSLAGATYAKAVAKKYEIEEFFVGFAGKPDIVIDDDMTSLHPKLKFAIKPETAWQT